VYQTPYYVCPVRTVPQSAQYKYNNNIENPPECSYSTASKRNVYLIPKPCR
jgi:hypothetical protein